MTPLRVCTQCGFTHAEFLERGLLGCPECYAHFGDVLFADLLHLHADLYRRAAPVEASGKNGEAVDSEEAPRDPARLREMFSDALRRERYEEAAALRERMRALGLDPRA